MTGKDKNKPFLYLPQTYIEALGWTKGDPIDINLVSEGEDPHLELRHGQATGRPVLRDSESFVHVDIDSELVTIPRSEITWPTKQRDELEVEAMTIFDAASVDFPEEKLLVAADRNLEWDQNGIVDLREHRRFDVRDKPNFGGG